MVHDKFIKVISLPLLMLCFSAFAESGSMGDLDNLQKERFLYEVKGALNKAKQEAESFGGNGVPATNGVSIPNGTNTGPQTRVSEDLPALVKISGRKAVVSLSDGSTRAVSVGEILPGGQYKIYRVSLNGVSVSRLSDGKVITLN